MMLPVALQVPFAVAFLIEKFTSLFTLQPTLAISDSRTDPECIAPPTVPEAKETKKTPSVCYHKNEQIGENTLQLFELVRKHEWNPELARQMEKLVSAGADVNFYNHNEFNHTPLVYALRNSRFDWILSLLANGADVAIADRILMNHFGQTACDIAWKNKNLEVARQLIQADGAFPQYKDQMCFTESIHAKRLKLFVHSGKKLHKNIERNKIRKVEKFAARNPKVKVVYNYQNQCALTTALKTKNFGIYSFLRSKGFSSGIDASHDEIIKTLSAREAEELKTCIERRFKTANLHVLDLVSKSRLENNNDDEDIGTVRRYFEALDGFLDIQPILKIIASNRNSSLVFNFERNSIQHLDRSKSFKIYTSSGIESENVEIVAKELTRLVLQLLYDNKGLPYRFGDEEKEKQFAKAADSFRKSLIGGAVDSADNISNDMLMAQVMAMLDRQTEKLPELWESASDLLEFYQTCVLPELTNEISLIKPRRQVQELNEDLGLFKHLKAAKLNCFSNKSEFQQMLTSKVSTMVHSSNPDLVITMLIRNFSGRNEVDTSHIFVTIEHLTDSKKLAVIHEALQSELQLTLVVLDLNDVDIAIATKLIRSLPDTAKTVFVSSRIDLKLHQCFPEQIDISFKCGDLDESSKHETLSTKISFQDADVFLSDIIDSKSEFFENLPLEDVIAQTMSKSTVLNKTLPSKSEIFIERSFGTNDTFKTAENILEQCEKEKTVVIKGTPGMGKTTSAVHFAKALKQRNRLSWIVFIDFMQCKEVFLEESQKVQTKLDREWITSKLLLLESTFEQKLFQHFYDSSKVFFVIDGYNGINEKFCLKFFKAIQESQNCLLVTTYVQSANEIEEALQTKAFEMIPFSELDQIEFLIQFWTQTSQESDLICLEHTACSVLNKIQKPSDQSYFLGTPLHLSMLAEVFENCSPDDLTLRSLYKMFVNKKIKSALRDSTLTAKDAAESFSTVLQFHQNAAIDIHFTKGIAKSLDLQMITEKDIFKVGLLEKTASGQMQFVHQPYAEFFIAEFIVENMTVVNSVQSMSEVLIEVLSNEKFKTTRDFMNDGLQTQQKDVDFGKLSTKLDESLNKDRNQGVLQWLIKEQQTNLLSLLFQTFNLQASTKVKLLKKQDSLSNEALHSAIASFEMFETLWFCIESFSNEIDQKTLLLAKGHRGQDVLSQALQKPHIRHNNAKSVSSFILKVLDNLLQPEEFKEVLLARDDQGETTIDFIFMSQSNGMVKIILNQIQTKLDKNQIQMLLLQECPKGETTLHRLCSNKSIPTTLSLWNFIARNLDADCIKSLLLSNYDWEGNLFNFAASNDHPILINFLVWLKKCSTHEELDKVFFHCNRDSWSFLHFVTWRCSDKLTSEVFLFISEMFCGDDIEAMLLAEDGTGTNPKKRSLENRCKLTIELVESVYQRFLGAVEV